MLACLLSLTTGGMRRRYLQGQHGCAFGTVYNISNRDGKPHERRACAQIILRKLIRVRLGLLVTYLLEGVVLKHVKDVAEIFGTEAAQ